MKKIELSINQLYQLQEELTSLLELKLSLLIKYTFSEIKRPVDEILSNTNKLKEEYINEYGIKDEKGIVTLKFFSDEEKKIYNPNYMKFSDEWDKILKETKEISYKPIPLKMISELETEKNIQILFKFIEQ